MIASRFITSLVGPVSIPAPSPEIILVPPLVIDPEQSSPIPLAEVAVQEIIGDRFHVVADRSTASIDDHAHKLGFGNGMTHLVEEITGNAIIVVDRGINHALLPAAKMPVAREFPLPVIQAISTRPGKWTAALAELGVVVDVRLIRNEGGVEVVVRHAGKVVLELGRMPDVRVDRIAVIRGDDKALCAQVGGDRAVVHHPHGGALGAEFGQQGEFPVHSPGPDVELNDPVVRPVLGQGRGIDPVAGDVVSPRGAVVKHRGRTPPPVGVVVVLAVQHGNGGHSVRRQHARRDLH